MQISYTYEYADWEAFTKAAWAEGEARRINGTWQRTNYYTGLIVFCLVVFVIDVLWQLFLPRWFPNAQWLSRIGFNLLSAVIGGFLFHVCTTLIAQATKKKRQRDLYSLTRTAGQPVTYNLADNGISFELNGVQGSCAWSAIKTVRVAEGYLFLFIAPLEAYIFPRRAFETDSDFEAATAFVKSHIALET